MVAGEGTSMLAGKLRDSSSERPFSSTDKVEQLDAERLCRVGLGLGGLWGCRSSSVEESGD